MARFNIESNIEQQSQLFGQFGGVLGRLPAVIGGVRTAMVALGTAISANPIGVVIVAIGAAVTGLSAVLRRFQPVIDIIDQGLAALGATFDVLADRIGFLFGVTERNTLSFREAAEAAIELERASQRLADQEIEQITISAQRRADFAEQRLIAADATRTDQERIDALTEAQRIQNEGIDDEIRLRTERLRILREQQALGANDRDDNREAAMLEAELINLDAQRLSQLRETESQRSGLILRTQQQAAAAQALREQEEAAAQAEVDRIREVRQQREIDLARAGGSSEEEVFRLRLERAETEEEQAQIMHERTIARLEAEREARTEAAATQMEADRMAMEVSIAAAASEAEATMITEDAKRSAREATAAAAINTLTSLLGDSKGAQIAGLVAQQAFEAATVVTSGTRAAALATAAANAAAVPTLGASLAALPAQLAAITASTTAGLTGVGIATATGIAGILAAPGEKPSTTGAGGGGAQGFTGGPTISTPEIGVVGADTNTRALMATMEQSSSVVAVIADGEVQRETERNARLNRRRTLGN